MKVSGSSVLHAAPDKVWQAINDPAVLAGVIPGCDQLTEIGDGHFGMTVTLGVAAIKGSYTGEVRLYDKVEPTALTMRANGAGGPGTIDTTVAVKLADLGDGTTQLDYDADAVVGGMVGGVGQRVLTSVARKTAALFFAAIDDVLTGKRAVEHVGPLPVAAAGERAESGLPAGAGAAGPGSWTGLVAAAAVGALAMLVGVLVGARIGRGARNSS